VQKYHSLSQFQDYHVVIGRWIIDNQPAGIGLRADHSPIASNQAIFVPNRIEERALECARVSCKLNESIILST
jgi:glutathionylspermidine synthase